MGPGRRGILFAAEPSAGREVLRALCRAEVAHRDRPRPALAAVAQWLGESLAGFLGIVDIPGQVLRFATSGEVEARLCGGGLGSDVLTRRHDDVGVAIEASDRLVVASPGAEATDPRGLAKVGAESIERWIQYHKGMGDTADYTRTLELSVRDATGATRHVGDTVWRNHSVGNVTSDNLGNIYFDLKENDINNAFKLDFSPTGSKGSTPEFSHQQTALKIHAATAGAEDYFEATGTLTLALAGLGAESANLTSLHMYKGARYSKDVWFKLPIETREYINPVSGAKIVKILRNEFPLPGSFVRLGDMMIRSGRWEFTGNPEHPVDFDVGTQIYSLIALDKPVSARHGY